MKQPKQPDKRTGGRSNGGPRPEKRDGPGTSCVQGLQASAGNAAVAHLLHSAPSLQRHSPPAPGDIAPEYLKER